MDPQELRDLAEEHGWDLHSHHGHYTFKRPDLVVKFRNVGHRRCEVFMRGIGPDALDFCVRLPAKMLAQVLGGDADFYVSLFEARGDVDVDNAQAALRRAKRDRRELLKLVQRWTETHHPKES